MMRKRKGRWLCESCVMPELEMMMNLGCASSGRSSSGIVRTILSRDRVQRSCGLTTAPFKVSLGAPPVASVS